MIFLVIFATIFQQNFFFFIFNSSWKSIPRYDVDRIRGASSKVITDHLNELKLIQLMLFLNCTMNLYYKFYSAVQNQTSLFQN